MRGVLITGAAGGVGHRVCRRLIDRGIPVRGLVRPNDDTGRLPLALRDLCIGSIQDPETVAKAMSGMSAVVHCAALLPNAIGQGAAAFTEVNVEGTRNVIREARRQGMNHLIAMSTISVVDHVTRAIGPGDLFDYMPDDGDPYLASKIAAERALREAQADFAGRMAILRLSYVYGPGNYAVWRKPLELLTLGKLRLLGDGSAKLPVIYADDIATFVLAELEGQLPRTPDGVHILADPHDTTMRGVFDCAADHLGVARPGAVPVWAAELGASAVHLLPRRWRRGRLEMLTRARVRQFSKGYDLSAVLDRPLLQRMRLTDHREGFRAMLGDYVATKGAGSL